jgi:hypothetical protein
MPSRRILSRRYNREVITRGIREFMARDWAAARAAKDQYWSDRVADLGVAEAMRVAGELRRQAQLSDPAWPHDEERREDLAAHVHLSALMRRADSARRA